MSPGKASPNSILRNLPSVDELLRSDVGVAIADSAGAEHAAALARRVIESVRDEISGPVDGDTSKEGLAALVESRLENAWRLEQLSGVRRVINATGVVIHTNLGRAPLAENARAALAEAAGYCTLEFDLETGKRGRRGRRAEELIVELTGAEDALVVNNCAAAAFFVLSVFAAGGEVIVSRGELVEIGGDFRVPDVLSQSGATLREVGTTNRTKLTDYEKAISKTTRVILRVHPSNYRIVGFTARPAIAELTGLAKKHKLLFYEDIGSGALRDVRFADEPVVSRSIAEGVDVVTFSGDKLLGGPQAGIIVGRRKFIEQLRKHPLYRALRVDKLALAALEATLENHRRGSVREIPVLQMLSADASEIGARVERFCAALTKARKKDDNLRFEIADGESAVGGGAAPEAKLATRLIALSHKTIRTERLEYLLRASDPPIITRVAGDRVLIDLRTVAEAEEKGLLERLAALA
jgi:L-seryl-tRNA(Ser) seleniumtransferase